MPTRRFDFDSPAGHRLSGRLEQPVGGPRGWALFAHCFTCSKNSVAAVRIARALAERGIGVLRFDFTGLGDSGGDFADATFSGDLRDLVAAAQAMTAAGMPPSLLVGHSFGGAAVLAAAGELPQVRAVATIAAPFDVGHVLHQFGEGLAELQARGEADVDLGGRPFRLRQGFLDDLRRHDQGARIAALHRPLLVLQAPTDQVVGIDNATKIFAAARHPKSFVSLDTADHLLSRPTDADYAAGVIAAWAGRYLPLPVEERAAGQPGEVTAEETGAGRYQVAVRAGGVGFLADEPVAVGGLGSGPTPYDLLSAALAACTTMTLRMYAEHKGWPVERIATAVGHLREQAVKPADLFTRRIDIAGEVDAEQRTRLLEIADRCPVHRVLAGATRIETALGDEAAPAESVTAHDRDMLSLRD